MLSEILSVITQVGMLLFIVGGMAAMGLGLTVSRIATPLRDVRMVLLLLLVNFVVVPAAAGAAARLLPMDQDAATAVVLVGCLAGAPFLPKLAQLAKGDVALGVGSMVLLMVVTVGYAPIVVPLVIPGVTVDPLAVAQSLVLFMLIPLGIGLLIRSRLPELADSWVGPVGQASSVGMLLGITSALLVSWQDVVGAIGTWIFVGVAIVLVAGLASGWLAGVGRPGDRVLLGLATAQRNIAAAIVVATTIGGDVVVLTLVGALVLPIVLIVLIVLAGAIGKRVDAPAAASPSA
jgi:BASS family bile acid:Na+ symporter